MVEPISPRLASARTSTPPSRSPAIVCSSTRYPADPYASKNATCGLTTAKPSNALRQMSLNRARPSGSTGSPQALSSPGCGSIPTHSGPRCATARDRRWPNPPILKTPARCVIPAATSRRYRRGCRLRCPAPPPTHPAPSSRTGCSSTLRPSGSRSRRCGVRSCRTGY